MQKTIMSVFETFIKMATSKPELVKFLSKAENVINKTTYNNGKTVFKHIDTKGVEHIFSQCPNGVIKESTIKKGLDTAGKKVFKADVIYHGGIFENTAGKTTIIKNKFASGNIHINGGNKYAANLVTEAVPKTTINAAIYCRDNPIYKANNCIGHYSMPI